MNGSLNFHLVALGQSDGRKHGGFTSVTFTVAGLEIHLTDPANGQMQKSPFVLRV